MFQSCYTFVVRQNCKRIVDTLNYVDTLNAINTHILRIIGYTYGEFKM